MSTGSLLLPLRYAPLHPTTGALVPGGKLQFYRTGTTTAQDTYSDSTLDTANSNPVVLSADGLLETKVYGDPSSGFDYRVRLYDANDVLLWTEDDVICTQSDVATIQTGSFTGTLTGFDGTDPSGTVSYRIVSDIGGTGKKCRLHIASNIVGTSDANTMTMTGLPAACQPSVAAWLACPLHDNTVSVLGAAHIAAAASTITFYIDATLSASGFTTSGDKGLSAGWQIEYAL